MSHVTETATVGYVGKIQNGRPRLSHGEPMTESRYLDRHRLDAYWQKRFAVYGQIKTVFDEDGQIKLDVHLQMLWTQATKLNEHPRPRLGRLRPN